MEQDSLDYSRLAWQALASYPLQDPHLSFIRQSDTMAYKVEASEDGSYLLRLHLPLNQAMGTHGEDQVALASELLWLEALHRDTELVLQQPVRNIYGALVTQIKTPGKPVNCTLLRWIQGDLYHRDLETADTACQIGKIAATLHNHASQWDIPPGFTRPKRDRAYFENVLRGIQPAVMDGKISKADYQVLETSIILLVEMIQALNPDRQTCGIMHADLHKGNLLIDHGEIRVIDFSFCALGNFMFDPAICMSDMKADLHPAFLEGYQSQRPLPVGYQRLIEGFFVGSMVGTFSYWVPNPQAAALLARKVPQIVQEYAVKFNHGESFWFER